MPGFRGDACGGLIVFWTDHIGGLREKCVWCERKALRLCQTCPARTTSTRARFCADCIAQRRAARKKKKPNAEQRRRINARQRRRYRENADTRARTLAAGRQWRLDNPERFKQWQRKYALDPVARARILERKRELYQLRKAKAA